METERRAGKSRGREKGRGGGGREEPAN